MKLLSSDVSNSYLFGFCYLIMSRVHPNKSKSGYWLPSEGDRHDLQTLLNSEPFFVDDYLRSEQDLQTALKFANYKLTVSKKSTVDLIAVRREAVKVSKANLDLLHHLIEKERQLASR